MKTRRSSTVHRLAKLSVPQWAMMIAALLAGGGHAESQDLKAFDAQESYVVEGASIVLTQKVGDATVKLKTAARTLQDASALNAANGANFSRTVELPGGQGIYRLQTGAGAASAAESMAAVDSLNSDTNIQYAYAVYVNPNTGNRVFLNDEIVVRWKAPLSLQDTNVTSSFKLKLVNRLSETDNIYVFRLADPKNFNPFKVCNAIRGLTNVVWVEPNIAQEANQFVIPNDTSFSSQWHLRNTGQTGAFSDADVDADDAWGGSQGYGSPGIRIAIIDDGVQTAHPDLSANVVQGYDFYSGDSDPNPAGANENHGTAVAGLSAAQVNNSLGVAGVSGKSQILPVRLLHVDDSGIVYLPSSTTVYRALLYAADNADIINSSWGGGSPDNTISAGFSYASTSGRNGYGCLVFCSSGNSAGGTTANNNSYATLKGANLSSLAAGNYFVAFAYYKDGGGSANDDCFWLADVTFPNGTKERFDSSTLPTGWQTGGNANWTTSIDPVHAHGTTRYALKSGSVGNNQLSYLLTPLFSVNSSQTLITYRAWISSQPGDQAWAEVYNSSSVYQGSVFIGEGAVAGRITSVAYPANLSSVFAVGATSDFDYRSHFSQYDSTLDFAAPGAGGYGGIATTDRTGTDGYASGDYNTGFGGTSASAPLAAGIAALVLSKDGKQSASTLATKLQSTCDKVGPLAYSGTPYTRNDYYGFGRLNANAAVGAVTADTTSPTFVSATVVNYRAVDVQFSEPMGDGALDPNNYTITAGQGTLSSQPSKVLRIGPVLVGYNAHAGTYRLIWNSGDMATSGTFTIQAASAIKDVAGNALTGTLSKSSTGTKRILAVDCGSPDSFSYYPPYLSDNGFQANEAAQFLTTSVAAQQVYGNYVDTSGVSDPAPQGVYQSWRFTNLPYEEETITYSLPNLTSGNKVRIHLTSETDIYSYQVFDIYINSVYKGTFYGGGAPAYTAQLLEYANSTVNGANTVSIVPQESGYDGAYRAAISGIEVVKP